MDLGAPVEYIYACEQCDAAFEDRTHFKQHRAQHESQTHQEGQGFHEHSIGTPCAKTYKQNHLSVEGQHDTSAVKIEVQEELLKDALNIGGRIYQAVERSINQETAGGTSKDAGELQVNMQPQSRIDSRNGCSAQPSASFPYPKRPRLETRSEGQNMDQVGDLLKMWHLYDELHEFFIENGLTIESLPKLTESDLSDIFKGRRVAKKLLFREKLIAWKAEKRFPPAVTLDSANAFENQSQPTNFLQTRNLPPVILSEPSEYSSEPPSSNDPIPKCQCNQQPNGTTVLAPNSFLESSADSPPAWTFSIDSFLASGTGQKLMKRYTKRNIFEPSDRDALVAGIAREHVDRNVCMTISMFEKISTQICHRFPNEKKEFYFAKTKKKATGKLYHKYRSMMTVSKRAGLFTSRLRIYKSPPRSNESENFLEDHQQMEEQQDDKEWLKTSGGAPWETVEAKWKATFSLRRRNISNVTLSQILEDWPSLAQSNGYRLIELDFDALHPGKSNLLLSKWAASEATILKACNKFVKFPAAKNLLLNLSQNPEVRIYEIFQVVQALVKPKARKMVGDQHWKVSIVDAWNSFAVDAQSACDVIPLLSKRKEHCVSRGIGLLPFLIVIKDSVQFVLVSEGIEYVFSSFLQALDIYFKIFFVLNLQYPFENPQFWQFIQTFFFEIHVGTDQPCEYQELMLGIETS